MMGYYNYDTGAFRGYCVLCGKGAAKRDLDRILAQNGRYGTPKIMAYACRECMSRLADQLGVELPDIDAVRRRSPNYLFCPVCRSYGSEGDRFCRKCGAKLEKVKADES